MLAALSPCRTCSPSSPRATCPKPISWASYPYLTDRVRYVGDVIALVAAETREIAEAAKREIRVDYEPLPAVFTVRDALKPGAPLVHGEYPGNIFSSPPATRSKKGDAEAAFLTADYVIEREYETQYVEHAYIEPEAAVAIENASNGEMTVHASAQNPFFTRRYVADILQLPLNRVRLLQETLGGSFGGKEEGVGLLAARCAYLCRLLHRPVKMVFSREESLLESSKRHPFLFTYKAGVLKDGRLLAWKATQIDNSGAYNNQTQFMNWRATAHCAGAYHIPNVLAETYGVFTNNIHSGAFRGYSSPELLFAQEQFIEEIAEEIGVPPLEMRRVNCLCDGAAVATGAEVYHVILPEMIDFTAEQDGLRRQTRRIPRAERVRSPGNRHGHLAPGLRLWRGVAGRGGRVSDRQRGRLRSAAFRPLRKTGRDSKPLTARLPPKRWACRTKACSFTERIRTASRTAA